MQTKTLEAIVELGLTTHFYVDLLLHGIQELQRLAVHHKVGAKQIELTINSYNRVKIPDDCLQVIDISIQEGERLLKVPSDSKLNKLYNTDDQGNKIPFPDPATEDDVQLDFLSFFQDYFYDYNRFGRGGYFGLNAPEDKFYNIDYENGEIVFSNDFREDSIVLTYATDPSQCTSCNLVRFEFWDVIRTYMIKKFKEHDKYYNQYEKESAKMDYINRKRSMKSLIYPVNLADFIVQVRRGIHSGIKSL